jgi:hypothetical protein
LDPKRRNFGAMMYAGKNKGRTPAMLKSVITAAAFAIATISTGLAQMPDFQPVELTDTSAANALDAMPAIFAVARNYDGQGVGGDMDGLVTGFAGLRNFADAQEQLGVAVGAYGFDSYPDWVATTQTILATYAYIKTAGAREQMAPAMDAAMQKVLDNPNIPQAQKDAIIAQLDGANAANAARQANAPSEENQTIVIALLPLVESTIRTMQAMQ